MFGITLACKSTFSTVSCMKCKYRSNISGANLVLNWKVLWVQKYTLDLEDFTGKCEIDNNFISITC